MIITRFPVFQSSLIYSQAGEQCCRELDGRRKSPPGLFSLSREPGGKINSTVKEGLNPIHTWMYVRKFIPGCTFVTPPHQIGELCKPPRMSPPSPNLDTDSQDSLCRVLSRHLLTSTMQGSGPGTRQVKQGINTRTVSFLNVPPSFQQTSPPACTSLTNAQTPSPSPHISTFQPEPLQNKTWGTKSIEVPNAFPSNQNPNSFPSPLSDLNFSLTAPALTPSPRLQHFVQTPAQVWHRKDTN